MRPRTSPSWSTRATPWPRSVSASTIVPRERIREEIGTDAYYGALAVEGSGLVHPGRYFAGLAAAADRAGADLHEAPGRRPIRRQGDGRFVVETTRGAILATGRVRRHERLHGRRRAEPAAPDHGHRLVHHRVRATPRGAGTRALARTAARSSTRRTSCTTGTCRPTAGWSSAGEPRSSRPPSTRPPGSCGQGLLEVHPQLADYRIEYAWGGNVGFTFDRMPHVGRTKDGVAYALGCCGTGVALMTYLGTRVGEWLAGGEAPALTSLRLPARAGAVRGPAVVPAVRRRVVPPAGPPRRADAAEG